MNLLVILFDAQTNYLSDISVLMKATSCIVLSAGSEKKGISDICATGARRRVTITRRLGWTRIRMNSDILYSLLGIVECVRRGMSISRSPLEIRRREVLLLRKRWI